MRGAYRAFRQGLVKSALDSDTVLISLRIENDVVQEVKFKCMGCAVAIACSSMATEMVLGQTVDQAYAITEQAVAEALGGIPEYKMRCSNLAPAAIRNAIDDWRNRAAVTTPVNKAISQRNFRRSSLGRQRAGVKPPAQAIAIPRKQPVRSVRRKAGTAPSKPPSNRHGPPAAAATAP